MALEQRPRRDKPLVELSYDEPRCRRRIKHLVRVIEVSTVGQLLDWAADQPGGLDDIMNYPNVGRRTFEALVDALGKEGISRIPGAPARRDSEVARDWTPRRIRKLRNRLQWSASDMANFFDRTRGAIYYWENGQSTPARNTRLVLATLEDECSYVRSTYSAVRFTAWSHDVKEKGLSGFLHDLIARPNAERTLYETLGRRAQSEGNILLTMNDGSPVACVVPLSSEWPGGSERGERGNRETSTRGREIEQRGM